MEPARFFTNALAPRPSSSACCRSWWRRDCCCWRWRTCGLGRSGTRRKTACSGHRVPKAWSRRELAPRAAAERAGLKPGDLLLAIGDRRIDTPADVLDVLHGGPGRRRNPLHRPARRRAAATGAAHPAPRAHGIQGAALRPGRRRHLHAARRRLSSGCGGRATRRRCISSGCAVAFFGVFTFSFSGRLDRLDWVVLLGRRRRDAAAAAAVPALRAGVPRRARTRGCGTAGRPRMLPLALPAGAAAGRRARRGARASRRSTAGASCSVLDAARPARARLPRRLPRRRPGRACCARCAACARSRAAPAAVDRRGARPSAACRSRRLRAAVRARGSTRALQLELLAIPLGLDAAGVRLGDRALPADGRRGHHQARLVYAAAIAAHRGDLRRAAEARGRAVPRRDRAAATRSSRCSRRSSSCCWRRPVKNAIQTALDRAFYRDRYDYRRALVGFARDLNSDLDLAAPERAARRARGRDARRRPDGADAEPPARSRSAATSATRPSGFAAAAAARSTRRRASARRLADGPDGRSTTRFTTRRFTAEEVDYWRDRACTTSSRASRRRARSRCWRSAARTAASRSTARTWRCSRRSRRRWRRRSRTAGSTTSSTLKADELDRMREFNENILESLDDGLLVVGLDERVVRWNPALETLYGDAARRGGRPAPRRAVRRAVPRGAARPRQRAAGAVSLLYRVPLVSRASRGRPAAARERRRGAAAAAGEGSTSTAGTIVMLEDITARVQLEEQLQISDKMASIGLLAAGVAHEVNTPLTGISSFTQMLLDGADPEDPRTQAAREDRAADVPRREDRQRPAEPRAGRPQADVGARRRARRRQRRAVAARAPVPDGEHPGAQAICRRAARSCRGSSTSSSRSSSICSSTRATRCRRAAGCRSRRGSKAIRRSSRWATRARAFRAEHLVADLRPVLHDQADRPGHRPRPVDHLRHRPRARRHDYAATARSGRARAFTPGASRSRRPAQPAAMRRGERRTAMTSAAPGPSRAASGTGRTMTRHGSILVIDDEEIMREILEALLTREGYDGAPGRDRRRRASSWPAPCRSTPPSST